MTSDNIEEVLTEERFLDLLEDNAFTIEQYSQMYQAYVNYPKVIEGLQNLIRLIPNNKFEEEYQMKIKKIIDGVKI